MKPVLTVEDVRKAERKAASVAGEDALIERAAGALFDYCLSLGADRFAVLAGGGNNGSDALSLASRLFGAGQEVDVFYTSEACNERNERRRKSLAEAGVRSATLKSGADFDAGAYDCVIDGLFGIGLSRSLKGIDLEVARAANERARFVVSVDVPSGLNADNGRAEYAFEADATVTFTAAKPGHYLGDGLN